MENPSPPRRPRLAWLALATFGTLLLLPASRSLLRTQLQMESLTYATTPNPAAESAIAASMPADYPVQLALAAEIPDFSRPVAGTSPQAESNARNRRILALAQRFPNNPSVYANALRYFTIGEMHLRREGDGSDPIPGANVIVYHPSPETLALFDAAAQKGALLDPDNAYFPMMQAIGLFEAKRDREALEALTAAARCSHWTEYYQDEAEGQNRLQTATYGKQGAMPHLANAANILFPQYAQLRNAARLAIYLAGVEEPWGHQAYAVSIRHAVMRCGGLMRSQGTSYITSLVGIAIANIAISDPGGMPGADSLLSNKSQREETPERRDARRNRYYSYMENIGQAQEAAWAKQEFAAADEAKSLGTEALHYSVFTGERLYELAISWLANLALLSGILVLLALGGAAHLAGAIRPKRALLLWRSVFTLLVLGAIGLWQSQAVRVGMSPYIMLQNMFCGLSNSGNSYYSDTGNALAIQRLTLGLGLLVPVLIVGLIAGITLFQRVPLATGLGRGLRGVAIPAAGVLFLIYGASLLPTARNESASKAEIAQVVHNEPHYLAESLQRTWPGDPQP